MDVTKNWNPDETLIPAQHHASLCRFVYVTQLDMEDDLSSSMWSSMIFLLRFTPDPFLRQSALPRHACRRHRLV